jgi:predicted CXXCH cytochrome family protein
MKRILLLLTLLALNARAAPGGTIIGSKHDFSGGGRSGGAEGPCVYCHASHGTVGVLSSRPESPVIHREYESSTLSSRPGAPGGASRACLSCHDGTVAIGATRGEKTRHAEQRIGLENRSNLGTDLRSSHPISMRPSPSRGVHPPPPGSGVTLDRGGNVQCTSCHDPHKQDGDPLLGMFLVEPAQQSQLCLSCHDSGAYAPAGAGHAGSAASLPPDAPQALGTMAGAGCLACHAVHGARPGSSLVARGIAGDDDSACLRCHSGSIAGAAPVALDLGKPYAHSEPGRHDPDEGPNSPRARLPEISPGARRHVACVDCHNPHAANDTPATRPFAGGALAGVWGISIDGQRVETVRYEYEVCLKCHGDSANKPQSAGPRPPETVRRAIVDANLRRVFSPSAASSHPVATPRRQASVPSLKPEWASVANITCSDCHGSDGGGVPGPHGSSQPHLLVAEYRTADRTPESPLAFALCYKCHDRSKLLSATSNFQHARHVLGSAVSPPTACATCHNAHGVSEQAGSPARNAHLIDFDVAVVERNSAGQRAYTSGGVASGSCALRCHGKDHDGTLTGRYP